MTTTPTAVSLTPSLAKKLRDLENRKKSVNQMIQLVTQQAENKIAEYNAEAQKVWAQIGKETGIDLQNVLWVPHPTEDKIIPVQQILPAEGLPSEPGKLG